MKKSAILLCVILFGHFCSIFKARVVPYPMGVIFPVEKEHELSYEGEIVSLIQTEDHFLYFSTRKGKIYCIDGQKREMLWEVDIPASLASPPYLTESRIYVNDNKNTLYCVDRAGKFLWETTLKGKITSGIAESGGQVYLGIENGLLFSLNADTGKELWQFQAEDAVRSNLVIWQDKLLFGCDDLHVYLVDNRGMLSAKYHAGGKTGKTLTVAENLLFFGTEDRYLHCVNLNRQKRKWRIRSGGATFVPPVVAGKRIFFLCWNCVLYCLNKNNGTILWWNSIPSRSYYRVEVIEKKVVVSSFSPELICFDILTGENKGSFSAAQEIKSNPTWLAPFLLINLHDPEKDSGLLQFLKKTVQVTLSSSKKSPNQPDEEITFRARDTGFHLPKFEFSLIRYAMARFYPDILLLFQQGEGEVVQESSELNTWDWFPQEEGFYSVGVVVVDEKEKAQAKLPFLIQKVDIHLSVTSSLESPQNVGQEIVFTVDFSGFVTPQFEFRLSRLKRINVGAKFPVLCFQDEEVVQETSEENSWTWIPGSQGLYLIRVIGQNGQGSATAKMAFVIKKE
ncbi:MAG: PQQ-like beta-propeller repeat protein [Candidatus Aminicenantes bacterium]|nr:MAG: PQQ-like beta-propeller repeat protein [Candidatus Aminicenantes bacterium]